MHKAVPIRAASIVLGLLGCWGLDLLCRAFLRDSEQRLVVLAGLYVTLAVSLNLINGIAGQFSIGHAAFYQIGAYTAGYLAFFFYLQSPLQGVGWLLAMLALGMATAALAGLVVGLPSLRLRGDYLAIVTLGFGEIIRIVVQAIDLTTPAGEQVGGALGMSVEPRIRIVGLVWLFALAAIAVSRNLCKSSHGLALLSIREDEIASAAMGVQVAKMKVAAFMIGSAFAGGAGVLLAHSESFISPSMFPMDLSFIVLTMVVLRGSGAITGSVVAALTLFYVPEYLRGLKAADGTALTVTGATLVGWILAVIAAVVAVRWIAYQYRGPRKTRLAGYAATFFGALLVGRALGWAFSFFPALSGASYEVQKLRMVIFAASLIIIMLLRPEGVLGRHEFSWDWLARALRIRRPREAVG
ncbi:MAG: branched-chain amino acid ABC transporter permease [Fimbriimonadales bacterium]|nr:branched-chain amino acid ABC transporter permease [Fimbriimonadales bacterium]